MSDIIKRTTVSEAAKQKHEGFCVGDYVTNKYRDCLYLITGITTRDSFKFYHCTEINPVTLDKQETTDMSESTINEFYTVLDADIKKLHDLAQRILHDGATIEDIQESSENVLMTLGNKQSLVALRSSIEESQHSVKLVESYCNLIKNQLENDLAAKIRNIQGLVSKMDNEISRLSYVVQTIETYTGIKEEIVTLQSGVPASEDAVIVIRQAVLFMDEEIALIDDDFDWTKIDKFDNWLLTDNNYKILLPDEKSIVAIKPRRTDKQYSPNDALYNCIMNQPNHSTLFLIRNGENLYRLESEHICLSDRMFPNPDEYKKVLEDESRSQGYYKDRNNKTSDLLRRRFTSVAFLLQGLLDRSDVFSPHHVSCSFIKMEGLNHSIRMEYELDTSHLLMDGRPDVIDWIKQTNAGICEGSRILLVSSEAFGRYDFLRWYNKNCEPNYPKPGIYSVLATPSDNSKHENHPYCIAYLPDDYTYSWTEGPKERKNKVKICIDTTDVCLLNYDDLRLDELDFYLNNRLYRSQYYRYVRLLKTARSFLDSEKRYEREFIKLLCGQLLSEGLETKDRYTPEFVVSEALQAIKDRLKWKRPISSKEKETYTLVSRTLFSNAFRKKYFK